MAYLVDTSAIEVDGVSRKVNCPGFLVNFPAI